jgi:membrane associated rhomboid family serine protease
MLIVSAMWLVFVAMRLSPLAEDHLALRPRSVRGCLGIATMPLVHRSTHHLLNNTWPLLVLLGIVAVSRRDVWKTSASVVIISGVLLWCVGRGAAHMGASALVFGLISFLVATGYFERRLSAVMISVVVGLLYGSTFLTGILPFTSGVSWEGHLCGGIAGVLVAYLPTAEFWPCGKKASISSGELP